MIMDMATLPTQLSTNSWWSMTLIDSLNKTYYTRINSHCISLSSNFPAIQSIQSIHPQRAISMNDLSTFELSFNLPCCNYPW